MLFIMPLLQLSDWQPLVKLSYTQFTGTLLSAQLQNFRARPRTDHKCIGQKRYMPQNVETIITLDQ